MKTESKAPPLEAQNEAAATAAHCCRVVATAIEVAKRLGWGADRQKTLQVSANEHHHLTLPDPSCLADRLASRTCESTHSGVESASLQASESQRLLEMCCFFAQRWEFLPYELTSYEDMIGELRTMGQDGFFIPRHVECLASVPAVDLTQVQEVVKKLPVFPAVALQAMKVSQNPNAGAHHVEAIVGSDPVLAGEVLRAANSPLYSPAMPIRSIRQAVVQMGMLECCRILAASAFRPLFQSPLVRPLWNHSLEVAKLSEALARTTGNADPEEAFLAGLVHDVGRLALWKLPAKLTAQYAALTEQGCEPMFAETLLASFDHTVAGREVMLRWNLPPHMIRSVELHHQPERCDSILTQVLYLAEHCSGSQEDMPSMARFKIAMERTGLDQAQLNALHGSASPLADW